MPMIERTMVLTGFYAGKTINLRGIYPFVNGELTLRGSEQDVNCEVRALEINFQAYIKGSKPEPATQGALNVLGDLSTASDKDPNGQKSVQGDGESDGRGPEPSLQGGTVNGDGAAGSETGPSGVLSGGDGQSTSLNPAGGAQDQASVGTGDASATETLKLTDPKDPKLAADGDARPTEDHKLKRAVEALDHKNDEHWTKHGLPSLDALANIYGSTGIKRADVEAAAPGYRRKQEA